MRFILFDRTEQQIGRLLPDLIDPREIEDLEGEHRLTFFYPLNADWASDVATGNYIAMQDMDNLWQLYEIIQTKASADTIEAECDHVYYTLGLMEYVNVMLVSASANGALGQVLNNTGWQAGVIEVTGTRTAHLDHINPLRAIRQIADLWGCELRFRVALSGTGIHAKYVDLLLRRGSDTGKRFEFGKDLQGIDITVDRANITTALYGWGQGEGIGEEGSTDRLTMADVEWVQGQPAELYPGGPTSPAPVSKPLGQLWVGDPNALPVHGRNGNHLFGEYESQANSPQSLIWETWRHLQKRVEPLVHVQAKVATLEQIPGWEHEWVRLGDTCIIRVPDVEPLQARVIRIDRRRKNPGQTGIELGNFRPILSDKLSDIERRQRETAARSAIWDRASAFNPNRTLPTSVLDGVIDAAKNQILAGGGTFRADGDGAWTTDTDDPNTALGAIRQVAFEGKAAIVGGKRNAPIDPWQWRVGFTSDGFRIFGEEVIAGIIRGALLEITSETSFAEGYDPSTKETPEGAQQKALDALAAAEAYANAIAELEAARAQAALEEMVSDETLARLAQAQSNLAEAKSHADQAAQAAEQAAKSHADTAASAARTAAETYALAQAEQKAAEAQAAAEEYATRQFNAVNLKVTDMEFGVSAIQETIDGHGQRLQSAETTLSMHAQGLQIVVTQDGLKAALGDLEEGLQGYADGAADGAAGAASSAAIAAAIQQVDGKYGQTHENINSHFSFTAQGLAIGRAGNQLQVTITNEEMTFWDGGTRVAYINGQKMYITETEILNAIKVGRHRLWKDPGDPDITLVGWVG